MAVQDGAQAVGNITISVSCWIPATTGESMASLRSDDDGMSSGRTSPLSSQTMKFCRAAGKMPGQSLQLRLRLPGPPSGLHELPPREAGMATADNFFDAYTIYARLKDCSIHLAKAEICKDEDQLAGRP